MLKKFATAAALAACLVSPAFAAPTAAGPEKKLDLNLQAPATDRGFADTVSVSTNRSPGAIILTDALYGGIAGAAIGAGVALINGNDYGRDIAVGAGIGLVAGGIIGAVDVAGAFRDQTRSFSEGSPALSGPTVGYGSKF